VAHIELTLADLTDPGRLPGGLAGSLELWRHTVSVAPEACLLVDASGVVVAASPGCSALLGVDPDAAVQRSLVGGVLHLLDFGPVMSDLPAWEVDKIPPRIAARTGGLARGLMRVAAPGGPRTVDAISVPLRDAGAGHVVGSLTFFALVR
jgi:hypothetical protein